MWRRLWSGGLFEGSWGLALAGAAVAWLALPALRRTLAPAAGGFGRSRRDAGEPGSFLHGIVSEARSELQREREILPH